MATKKRVPRCVYAEGRRRCSRPGKGNPPLCTVHEMVLEEDPPPVTLDDVLDDLFGRAEDLARTVTNRLKRDLRQLSQEPPRVVYQRVKQAVPPPRPRAERPSPPPRTAEPDAREVLGFAPTVKLTREVIKARQRELARIFHTDRGGNDNAMKRINVAAKTLLDGL